MVLLIEGSFLLLIAIYAFLNGVFGIINGGRDIELGLVIVYAAVFTVVEFAYYFWVKRKNRKLKSTLIQFDNVSWLVDAMLSVGLLISFVTALVLKHQGYAQWAAYVDPAILILLALSMLAPAFKILKPALRDVLGIVPDALDDKVRDVLEAMSARHGFEGYKTYVQKHGRARFNSSTIRKRPLSSTTVATVMWGFHSIELISLYELFVAAAVGCDRRRSRRKINTCNLSVTPHTQALRLLRNRTQPSAAATNRSIQRDQLNGDRKSVV